MITFSLQSGSNGNCIYVEAGGVRLLFDAGISGRTALKRMEQFGRRIREVDALILSHDHVDHVQSAGAFHRLFGMPVYCTAGTHRVIRGKLGEIRNLQLFKAGAALRFGAVVVHTIPTPHDAADGVAFVVEFESRRLGVFTDLGHPFRRLQEALASCDAAYLESNYDQEMLEKGPYPADLKRRIRGDGGHLSNDEAAELVSAHARRTRWIALAHLSAENNHPEVAIETHRAKLGEDFPLCVAGRDGPSALLEV
ncbi:MAG: MBL fold metallo-hydrolase [Planctomycetes bacterium]|nr:MBL fold metallo-hydrolase [Planctomycetota bacterium]